MKKKIAGIVTLSMLLAMSTTAFAHGHGGGHHSRRTTATTTSYALCSVDGCNLTYNHNHNGVTYAGHHNEDGHNHCYY